MCSMEKHVSIVRFSPIYGGSARPFLRYIVHCVVHHRKSMGHLRISCVCCGARNDKHERDFLRFLLFEENFYAEEMMEE